MNFFGKYGRIEAMNLLNIFERFYFLALKDMKKLDMQVRALFERLFRQPVALE